MLNNAIDSGAQRRPNVDVVDWSSYVGARPELFTRAQVHVNPMGQTASAALLDRIITHS